MPELPSGTVTFLFTDIEGSTRLQQELGERYTELRARHHRLVREAIARHGGVEVDTAGDGFFVAFPTASGALAAAQEAQVALAGEPLRVRIGIHTGEASLSQEGYVGVEVVKAARIAACAHGGQVLVSQQTRDLAAGDSLRDLGLHRLKDVGGLRLFQLGDGQFPPPKTLNQTNLPLPPTPLVGRKKELAAVLKLFGEARLVTLTGPGGIGKTRFALEVAGELVERFADGVFFSDLSAVRDTALVVPAIASVLGAGAELHHHIADKELLLLLDNLEQVVEVAPELAELLERCSNLHVLATSREPLRIRGEREYPLRPLAEAPAVELFRQRAEAARPDFEADYETLVEICERLDRLPLAIELAAARTRLLSAEALRERLEQRLPLLAGGARDLPERQRTLRATIEWSYELLSPEEQQLFRRLAVFAGGFTLEAAEQVCGADLHTLESLVEKSLVRRDRDRFAMLETIREYAGERLEATGESAELRARHAERYRLEGEHAERSRMSERADVIARLSSDLDNFRAAFRWAGEDPQARPIVELARVAGWFGAPSEEWRVWMEQALAATDTVSPARAKVLERAGFATRLKGDVRRAQVLNEQALAAYRALGDQRGVASALGGLGDLAAGKRDFARARSLYEEELELFRQVDDPRGVYETLRGLGEIEREAGNLDHARRLLAESISRARQEGDPLNIGRGTVALADVAFDEGAIETASALYREALSALRGENGKAHCLAGLAAVAAREGREVRAGRLWGGMTKLEQTFAFKVRVFERERAQRELVRYQGSDRFARAVEEGAQMSVDDILEYARADVD